MSQSFIVRIPEFTREHVQRAMDSVSQQIALLLRSGNDDLLAPNIFGIPDKGDVQYPVDKCIAYDTNTKKLIRYNGSIWVDLT
jgi:hypothetical protein